MLAPLLPLAAAIGAAGAYIAVQACTQAGAPRSAIVHCFVMGNMLLGGCAVLLNGDVHVLRAASATCRALLALCGFVGWAAQLALTAAIGLDSASTVAIAMPAEVAFAFILEAAVFGTPTSVLALLGALMTALGLEACSRRRTAQHQRVVVTHLTDVQAIRLRL